MAYILLKNIFIALWSLHKIGSARCSSQENKPHQMESYAVKFYFGVQREKTFIVKYENVDNNARG
jgi:hypothetical protein